MTMRGKVRVGLLLLAAVAVVGFGGYRYFASRPGEAAVALVPSDASIVVTLDTNPSQAQVPAFMKIANAMKREGLDEGLEEGIDSLIGKSEVARQLRPYVTHNFALAVWMGDDSQPRNSVVLVAIKSASAVEDVLKANGAAAPEAGEGVYKFREGLFLGVVEQYLLIASDAPTIQRVRAVGEGRAPSMASLSAYAEARAALPADANFMAFLSPEAMVSFQKLGAGAKGPAPSAKWMAVGAAVRDGGLQIDYRGPISGNSPAFQRLASIKPLDPDITRRLPEGAYGILAYSQPAEYFPIMEESLRSADASISKSFDEGIAAFEKESGLKIKDDILPALRGDVVLAVYPGAKGSVDFDALVYVSAAGGSTPADLADKVRELVERKSREEKRPITFDQEQVGRATVWSLDGRSTQELQNMMFKGMGANPEQALPAPLKEKGVLWAVMDGGVILASSRAMLNRALAAQAGGRTLADDPAFATMGAAIVDGSQSILMVNLGRIMATIRETAGKEGSDLGPNPEDLARMFGDPDNGLVASGKMTDGAQASLFLPLDYDRLAKVIAGAAGK